VRRREGLWDWLSGRSYCGQLTEGNDEELGRIHGTNSAKLAESNKGEGNEKCPSEHNEGYVPRRYQAFRVDDPLPRDILMVEA
jgi:hypothetical protein